jgi:hypothetical protein
MFSSLVVSSADEALRFFYALSEVVAATAAHTHAALTSFPEPLRLVSSSTKGESSGYGSVRGLLAFHSQDQRRSPDRSVLVTLAQRVSLDPSRCVRELFACHQLYLSASQLEPALGHVSV